MECYPGSAGLQPACHSQPPDFRAGRGVLNHHHIPFSSHEHQIWISDTLRPDRAEQKRELGEAVSYMPGHLFARKPFPRPVPQFPPLPLI